MLISKASLFIVLKDLLKDLDVITILCLTYCTDVSLFIFGVFELKLPQVP